MNLDGYTLTELDTYAMNLRGLRDDFRASGNNDMASTMQRTIDVVRDAMQDRLTVLTRRG